MSCELVRLFLAKKFMPRFVLLFHDCPTKSPRESHWDFMLESGTVLRTWALSANPASVDVGKDGIEAEQIDDHRLAYLEYEGPISNGRGSVVRVDAGQFELKSETECELVLELFGERLRGSWNLTRSSTATTHWLLRWI
jgi:hypothetical protein